MRKRILLCTILTCCISTSYAINVSIQTPSQEVSALGFTVDGKNHGGMGRSYTGKNMPAGNYSFGIRIHGVFGTDVPCYVNDKRSVMLNQDATVMLQYSNNKCTGKLS
jgi:hypothetical protein